MDEHINGFIQRHSFSIGHGQEAEAHANIEPLAHAGSVEELRLLLGVRPFVLLGLTHSCKNQKRRRVDSLEIVSPLTTQTPCNNFIYLFFRKKQKGEG